MKRLQRFNLAGNVRTRIHLVHNSTIILRKIPYVTTYDSLIWMDGIGIHSREEDGEIIMLVVFRSITSNETYNTHI